LIGANARRAISLFGDFDYPRWTASDAARKLRRGVLGENRSMCRNIRTLFNFEPPATEEEVRASALQFVRKLSGFAHPSKANQAAFDQAVDDVAAAARRLLASLETTAPTRDRASEAAKAQERARRRFARA
jgi:hypothetical protein